MSVIFFFFSFRYTANVKKNERIEEKNMNYWMKTIINRLETAYQTRFDMKASLVFLNDAYQNSIELIKTVDEKPSNELEEFLELFMTTRDLFIRQLVDRYPSNYHDVEVQIQKLKAYSD